MITKLSGMIGTINGEKMVAQILILVLILGICPFLCGMVPAFFIGRQRRTAAVIYLSGFITCMAMFQLICVPIVVMYDFGFPYIVNIYSGILVLLSIAGLALAIVRWKMEGNIFAEAVLKRTPTVEEIIEWIMVAVIIAFQIVMFVRMTSFDGDDAYYVVQSLLTDQTDTLYRIRPYTGLSTSFDLRHSLAVLPMWIAYVARVSGVHSTIIAHNVLGIMLIPVSYMIYFEIGRNILKREQKKLPIFMIFVAIMQVFGNVSIYTNATFFLTRTWQGKSILANVCIPGVLWLLLTIFDSDSFEGDRRFGLWINLFALNIVAAMSSTSSVFLIAMLIGLSGLVLAVKEKNVQILLRLIITCIPLVGYGATFLLL